MTQQGLWIIGVVVLLLVLAGAAIWFGMSAVVESDVRGVSLP